MMKEGILTNYNQKQKLHRKTNRTIYMITINNKLNLFIFFVSVCVKVSEICLEGLPRKATFTIKGSNHSLITVLRNCRGEAATQY